MRVKKGELERRSFKWTSLEGAEALLCVPFPPKKWGQKPCFSLKMQEEGLSLTTEREVGGPESRVYLTSAWDVWTMRVGLASCEGELLLCGIRLHAQSLFGQRTFKVFKGQLWGHIRACPLGLFRGTVVPQSEEQLLRKRLPEQGPFFWVKGTVGVRSPLFWGLWS